MTTNPTTHKFDNVRPVLVPVDPSGCAAEVVGAAADVCAGLGAKAILLDVVHSPDGVQRGVRVRGGTVEAVLQDDACAHLRDLAEILQAVGVEVDLSVREGEVVKTILEEASGTGAQMIVMGTHGRTGLSRLMYGSVAESVIRSAEVPVMVVRTKVGLAHPGLSEAQQQVEAETMG
jgi:universal stress protein A